MKKTAAIVGSAIATALALGGCVPPHFAAQSSSPSPGQSHSPSHSSVAGHVFAGGAAAAAAGASRSVVPNDETYSRTLGGNHSSGDAEGEGGRGGFGAHGSGSGG